MVRTRVRLPGFCMSRAATARVRVQTQPQPPPQQQQQFKQNYNSIFTDDKGDFSSNSIDTNFNGGGDMLKLEDESELAVGGGGGNRVMVVVDASLEAKGALQWALSHTIQTQDTIVLLHVIKPQKKGVDSDKEAAYELLRSMKDMCQTRRTGVNVEISVVEGKEKGSTIVEEAKQQTVSLLVLGQRKRSILWRLKTLWTGKKTRSKVVEYCIQNASCMTIAVRRKSRKYNHGGYLITTKRHKNFWLLA